MRKNLYIEFNPFHIVSFVFDTKARMVLLYSEVV